MRYLLSLLLLASTAFADEAAVKALAPTAWWKSYKGLTTTSVRGISAVADQSGNSRTLVQAAAGNRPAVTRGDNREQRISFLTNVFDLTNWSGGNGIAYTADAVANPLTGVVDADQWADTVDGAPQTHRRFFSFNVKAEPLRVSVYVKRGAATANNTTVRLAIDSAAGAYADYNLALGTVSGQNLATGAIEPLSGGWYRITTTYTFPAPVGAGFFIGMGGSSSWQGDGTSIIYLYGFQHQSTLADATYTPGDGVAAQYRGVCNTAGNHCLPAIRFDGVDDTFNAPGTLADYFSAGGKTMFALLRFNSVAGQQIFADSNSANRFGYNATNYYFRNDDGAADSRTLGTATIGNLVLLVGRHSGGMLYLDINGATDATGLASGNTSNLTGTIKVGDNFGSVFLNADLIELITFNTALSPANQAVVEAYLNGVMSASADPWKRVSVLP